MNGDGYDDFLIGAALADAPFVNRNNAGETYLIYGGNSLPATINLETLPASAGMTVYGAFGNDQSGYSVSGAGDVNGDGYDDLLIGAWLANGPSGIDWGRSYLIYGGNSLPATIDLIALSASAGVEILGAAAFDNSGHSVSGAGDVNNDGYDDLLIGAINADGPGNSRMSAGDSYLIYGGTSLPPFIALATLPASSGVTIYGAEIGDQSGYAVSGVGDVNGDEYDDLLIGAWLADGASGLDYGRSYLIYGGASLPTTIDLATLTGSEGVMIDGAEVGDQSGYSVSGAGDVNNDGNDDLLIGAVGADGPTNNRTDAGESYLIYGGTMLPATIDLATLTGSAGVIIYGAEAGDFSGASVSGAGDVDNDGKADLIIGAFGADGPTNSRLDTGESYLILAEPALGVQLRRLEAVALNQKVMVRWETASEVNTLGFNLYRATHPDAEPTRLNGELIPSTSPGGGQGATYEWLDETVESGVTYYYWLDDVDGNGNAARHGPVSATASVPTAVQVATLAAQPATPIMLAWLVGIGITLLALLGWRRR